MKMGLVGFSGSGKSTVFEWLTGEKPDPAKVQQGQTAMADVPDERLARIAAVMRLKKAKPVKEREADEAELALLRRIVAAFEAGTPASRQHLTADEEKAVRSFQLLTLKPEIVFVNRGDSGFNDPLPADLLGLAPTAVQAPVKLETELLALPEEDRQVFMADMGLTAFQIGRASCREGGY